MRRSRRGLSLVELAVVVAIIAIVMGMLLTTMRKVWKVVHSLQSAGPGQPVAMVVHFDGDSAD
jgi:prepilin-type N-terminal cleavage/methylation domain-containing protein